MGNGQYLVFPLFQLLRVEGIDVLSRAILKNAATFHRPEEFIPERYEGANGYPPEPDLSYISFGFGRR